MYSSYSCTDLWILVFVSGFEWIVVFIDGFVGRFLDLYMDSGFCCGFLDSWWITVDSKQACTDFGMCQRLRSLSYCTVATHMKI